MNISATGQNFNISPTSHSNDVKSYALRYAAEGLGVIPVHPGSKRPIGNDWQHRGETDPLVIEALFPSNTQRNVGIVLGDQLAALDVDVKGGGINTLLEIESKYGKLPRTPTQKTGSGGFHYLFRVPLGAPLGIRHGFLPGFDLKTGDSQIVAAPSVNEHGGTYEWLEGLAPGEVDIADMPVWLKAILSSPSTAKSTKSTDGTVREGSRNSELTRYAGMLRARGVKGHELRAQLLAYNAIFEPPLDTSEVMGVAKSADGWADGAARYPANDAGLAKRFADEFAVDLRFVSDTQEWLTWDGNRWKPDADGEVVRRFIGMAEAMQKEAQMMPTSAERDKEAERKAKVAWARQTGEQRRIAASIRLASTDQRIAISSHALDKNAGRLAVANGVIDLRTGMLTECKREQLVSKACSIAYVPDAVCPEWEAVVARALPGDLGPFMQRVLGYALIGNPVEQLFFLLCGAGADSKSTITRVVKSLIGDLASSPASETLLAHDRSSGGGAPRADLMGFKDRRLIIASEPDSRLKLDQELIKRLTGGDGITARAPYGRAMVEFEMTGTIMMLANHLPGCDEADEAVWRRLRLIPFDHPVPEDERDPRLVERLIAQEGEGILRWLVDGAREYLEADLRVPDVVKQRTSEWRCEVGTVERYVRDNHPSIAAKDASLLHGSYQMSMRAQSVHPMGLDKFVNRLKQLGYTVETTRVNGRAREIVSGSAFSVS